MGNTIYLVIGPSCSGKTQFVTNSFIKNPICEKDLIKITKSDTSILIGDYTINKKVRGTDRISRSQLKLIAPQIIKSFKDYPNSDIVAEGVNICWKFVLDELIPYKDNIKLIYLYCTKEMSLLRNKQLNPNSNDKWFKSVWTKSDNIFNIYKDVFDSYIFDTENYVNFAEISLHNVELISVQPSKTISLF